MYTRYNTGKPVTGLQLNRRHSLSKGLIACWLMNEGSGSKVFDLSGHHLHGTLESDAVYVATNKYSPGIYMDGTADDVLVSHNSILDLTPEATICVLVRPEWVSGTRLSSPCIVSKRVATSRYSFHMDNNYGYVGLWNGADYDDTTGGGYTFIQDTWYYLVFVMKASTTDVYVNGNLIDTLTNTIGAGTGDNLRFGESTDANENWVGTYDHSVFYNRGLTATEIIQLYRNPFCMFWQPQIWGVAPAPVGNNVPQKIHHYQMAGGL